MTVKELKKKLSEFPDHLEVLCKLSDDTFCPIKVEKGSIWNGSELSITPLVLIEDANK